MKLLPITLLLVTTLGLAACETETEVVMEPVGDAAKMEEAARAVDAAEMAVETNPNADHSG
ncbi:MAG: hypothetical protein ACU0CA_10320 [Paracoccaceae bacterium]